MDFWWLIPLGIIAWVLFGLWAFAIVRSGDGRVTGWGDADDPLAPECIGTKPGPNARRLLSCDTCEWRHTCASIAQYRK